MAAPLPVRLAAPAQTLARWWSGGPRQVGQARSEEENLWMSQEDTAPAWAVSLLTLAALATLVGLALMG